MQYVSDLHLHSPFSRAVSPQMTLPQMAQVAVTKGIDLLSASDWTHPKWIEQIQEQLKEVEEGVYGLKEGSEKEKEVGFILGSEISSIYKQGDKLRRIHNLVFVPSFETAEKVSKELRSRGSNLNADGRPIIGLSSHDLLELILEIDEGAFLIPAHVWTPHFGVYGSASGFDSLDEAFGDLSSFIYGIETGLSSDPEMNWQIPQVQKRSILSFSDAHSPSKMGRELTIFELKKRTFGNLRYAINCVLQEHDVNYVVSTVEFYPEEGKYHYSGHRTCKVSRGPEEIEREGNICPVCRKKVTEGVFFRLQQLSGSQRLMRAQTELNEKGLLLHKDPSKLHGPFVKLVPLLEIVAEALGVGVGSKKVQSAYADMVTMVGTELAILTQVSLADLSEKVDERIVRGIEKVRKGDITIKPGFDGEYGVVHIWDEEEKKELKKDTSQLQLEL